MNWHEYFIYDAEMGNLIWKERIRSMFSSDRIHKSWNATNAGNQAKYQLRPGSFSTVCVNGRNYRAHRVIWEMHNGPIPDGAVVDHINGDQSDDRIENIRIATRSQNQMNRLHERDNLSGLKGVSYHKRVGIYIGQICKNKTHFHLGYFHTKGEAAVAYAKASLRLHGAFSPFMRKMHARR